MDLRSSLPRNRRRISPQTRRRAALSRERLRALIRKAASTHKRGAESIPARLIISCPRILTPHQAALPQP
nr:MAG TPA: hypothetical protein [Caudoviricetes sp.]